MNAFVWTQTGVNICRHWTSQVQLSRLDPPGLQDVLGGPGCHLQSYAPSQLNLYELKQVLGFAISGPHQSRLVNA